MDIAYYVNSAESRVARLPAAMGFARRNRPGNPSPPLASYPSNPSYSSYYDNTYYPNRQQHQVRNRKTPFRMECERELEGVESECRHGQESEETMTGSVMKTVPHAGASLDGSPHTTTRTIDQIPTTTTSPSTSTTPALGALDDQYTLSSNPPNPKNSFRYGDWICRVNGCSAHNFGRNVVCIGLQQYPQFHSCCSDERHIVVGREGEPSRGDDLDHKPQLRLEYELERVNSETTGVGEVTEAFYHPSLIFISFDYVISLRRPLLVVVAVFFANAFTPLSNPDSRERITVTVVCVPVQLELRLKLQRGWFGLGWEEGIPAPFAAPLPFPFRFGIDLNVRRGSAGRRWAVPLPPPDAPARSSSFLAFSFSPSPQPPSTTSSLLSPDQPAPLFRSIIYLIVNVVNVSIDDDDTPPHTLWTGICARRACAECLKESVGAIRPPLNLHHAPPTNTTQSNDVNGGVAPLAGNLPPILNTGNKGPIVNQPGDWICGVYAEGNGDSISAAVQAERMALLTEVLMNAKNQIELDSQGSQRAGHSLSQQPQSQQLQGYSRSSQFEQGGQQRQHSLPLPHQLQVQPNQQRYQREGQSMSQPTSPLPFANPNTYAQFQATSNAGLGLGSNVSPSFALSTKHQQQQMGGAGVGVIGGGFAPANRPLPTAIGNGAGNGAGIASATSALLAPIYQTSPPRQREKADIEGDADGEDMLLPSFLQTLVRSPASSSSHSLSSPPSSSHSHSSPPSSASTSPSPNGDDHEGTLSSTPTTPFTHSFGYSHPSLHGYPYAYSSPSPSSTSHSNSHSTFVSPMSSKPTSVGSSPDLGCHSQAEKLTLVGGGASGVGVIGRGRVRNPSAESTSTSSSISESEESEGFSSNASVVSSASSATTTTSNSHSHPHSHSNGKSKSHSPSPLRNTNSSTSVSGGSIWQISAEENLNLGPLGGVGGSFGGILGGSFGGSASASGSRVGSRKSSFERLQAQLGGMSISGGV
ncbi:hypothetical protein ONZ45_g8945 [Pleurotus djamor]|nr:hypothetical protein ONZ45_g8945 [Pleurotus djamor]